MTGGGRWVRSSQCGTGTCVEVKTGLTGAVYVRNAGHPKTVTVFGRAEWEAFTAGVKNGEFDLEDGAA